MKYAVFINRLSWLFAIILFVNGIINVLWGNDLFLGISFLVLAFIYVPPFMDMIKQRFGFSLPYIGKVILGLILIWIMLAVGAVPEGYL